MLNDTHAVIFPWCPANNDRCTHTSGAIHLGVPTPLVIVWTLIPGSWSRSFEEPKSQIYRKKKLKYSVVGIFSV